MTEALIGMLDYMYGNIDLNRVQALVDPKNEGSLRLIEKQGFQRDGLLRSYESTIEGPTWTSTCYHF